MADFLQPTFYSVTVVVIPLECGFKSSEAAREGLQYARTAIREMEHQEK